MRFNHVLSFSCIALLIVSCRPNGPFYTPYFNPQQATTYQYTISEATQTMSTEQGVKVSRRQNVLLSFDGRTAPATRTAQSLHLRLDAFELHERGGDKPEKNLIAATAAESNDPALQLFGAYQGATMDCNVDNQGQVLSLPGFDNIYKRMGQGSALWQQRFDQTYFAHIFEKGWRVFPDGPIALGDTWSGMDSLNADPHIPLLTHYTLVKVWAGALYIQTYADVDIQDADLRGVAHGGQLSLKGRQRGLIRVDQQTGMVLDGQTRLTADGVLSTGAGHISLNVDSTCSIFGNRT